MSVYLNDGMVLLDSGMVATSTDCCCGGPIICGDCFCVESGPFEDGMGGFWTHNETDCEGVTIFSGATTFDAKFATFTQVRTCCPPQDPNVFTCTENAVCIDPGPPKVCGFVDTGNGCDGDDCIIAFVSQTLSNQIDPPCP